MQLTARLKMPHARKASDSASETLGQGACVCRTCAECYIFSVSFNAPPCTSFAPGNSFHLTTSLLGSRMPCKEIKKELEKAMQIRGRTVSLGVFCSTRKQQGCKVLQSRAHVIDGGRRFVPAVNFCNNFTAPPNDRSAQYLLLRGTNRALDR